MTNKLLVLITLLTCLSGCKKDTVTNPASLLPISNFSVLGTTLNNVITVGTYDQIQVSNNSSNANSYFWTFGDGSTSKMESPVLSFPKSGTYNVTLTAQNSDGVKRSTSTTVKVLDRIIKKVVIRGLVSMNGTPSPSLNKPNVYAVIKLGENNIDYPFQGVTPSSFNAPIVYQSPILSNIDLSNIPYTFTVPNKIVLNFPALAVLSEGGLGYKGIGYGLELYTQDDAAATYLLSSSYQYFYMAQSGAISWPVANIQNNIFIARYGNIDLVCDYE